jgi:hypothetical protein
MAVNIVANHTRIVIFLSLLGFVLIRLNLLIFHSKTRLSQLLNFRTANCHSRGADRVAIMNFAFYPQNWPICHSGLDPESILIT